MFSLIQQSQNSRQHDIYDAMNKGLDRATGDFVLFLNADDRFASATTLANAVAAIERDAGADVYYGWLEVRPLDGANHVFRPPPPADAPRLMICGCLPHQSTLARPSVFARTGRFDLRYRYHADYDWFLKVLADPAIDVRTVDEVIGSFQVGGTSSQLAEGQPEVYAIQNRSPLYATPEWDNVRIAVLQEAFLRERIEAGRLREEIRAAGERALSVRPVDVVPIRGSGELIKADWRVVSDAARIALGPIRGAVRSWVVRMRWWTLEACVRYLPPATVGVLRRVRARGRGIWAGR